MRQLQSDGRLEDYQAQQGSQVFECDYVVVFLGLPGTTGLFAGIWEVRGRRDVTPAIMLRDAPNNPWWSEPRYRPPRLAGEGEHWWQTTLYIYDLQRTDFADELTDRLVIRFEGILRGARWLEGFKSLPIAEIRALGRQKPFMGFDQVCLSYGDLKRLIDHPEANPDWHHALNSTAGTAPLFSAAYR